MVVLSAVELGFHVCNVLVEVAHRVRILYTTILRWGVVVVADVNKVDLIMPPVEKGEKCLIGEADLQGGGGPRRERGRHIVR